MFRCLPKEQSQQPADESCQFAVDQHVEDGVEFTVFAHPTYEAQNVLDGFFVLTVEAFVQSVEVGLGPMMEKFAVRLNSLDHGGAVFWGKTTKKQLRGVDKKLIGPHAETIGQSTQGLCVRPALATEDPANRPTIDAGLSHHLIDGQPLAGHQTRQVVANLLRSANGPATPVE
ncbi:MAG: hypothetical protein ABFC88_11135 [Thermoguttaceae bacterium]